VAAATIKPRIGVISDNHGYLDPVVLERFAGVTHIIHAGDIVDPGILAALESVAPVTAVAGNLDDGELGERLPREVSGVVSGVRFVVGHKPKRLLKRLSTGRIEGARPDLVVWGHTHVPSATWVDGALYLNPGTASSPDEEDDGPSVAIVEVEPTGLAVRFIPLARRQVADAEVGRARWRALA
jgi:putative phosphoesterase